MTKHYWAADCKTADCDGQVTLYEAVDAVNNPTPLADSRAEECPKCGQTHIYRPREMYLVDAE